MLLLWHNVCLVMACVCLCKSACLFKMLRDNLTIYFVHYNVFIILSFIYIIYLVNKFKRETGRESVFLCFAPQQTNSQPCV